MPHFSDLSTSFDPPSLGVERLGGALVEDRMGGLASMEGVVYMGGLASMGEISWIVKKHIERRGRFVPTTLTKKPPLSNGRSFTLISQKKRFKCLFSNI